jgi:hypothetical protein
MATLQLGYLCIRARLRCLRGSLRVPIQTGSRTLTCIDRKACAGVAGAGRERDTSGTLAGHPEGPKSPSPRPPSPRAGLLLAPSCHPQILREVKVVVTFLFVCVFD